MAEGDHKDKISRLRQRKAIEGEVCTCGKAAKFITEGNGMFETTGWCGGPCDLGTCPFCEKASHIPGTRCLLYELTPNLDWFNRQIWLKERRLKD